MNSDYFAFYFVADEEFVLNSCGEEIFRATAYSGGARTTENNRKYPIEGIPCSDGSYHDRSLESFDPNRVTKNVNKDGNIAEVAGGPIPPGEWSIVSYKFGGKTQGSLLLRPEPSVTKAYKRDYTQRPFLIHVTGVYGSWGCITMPTKDLFKLFKNLLPDAFYNQLPAIKELKKDGSNKEEVVKRYKITELEYKFPKPIPLKVIFSAEDHSLSYEYFTDKQIKENRAKRYEDFAKYERNQMGA